jgi:hypothetical protein
MMKKNLLFTVIIFFACLAYSQDYDTYNVHSVKNKSKKIKEPFIEKCYAGGSLSLQIGNFATYVDISPLFGYQITEKWSLGLGATYKYADIYSPFYNVRLRGNVFGGGPFTRLILFDFLFAHAEAEFLNTVGYDVLINNYRRLWVPVTAAGLGYKGGDDDNYGYFMILYDFNNDPNTPYPLSPLIIKAGFIFSLGK